MPSNSVEEPLLATASTSSVISCAYEPITNLSHYEKRLLENDMEKKLRERFNAYPRVTFGMGVCMLMVGFQWMVQQVREEYWWTKLGLSVTSPDMPQCYVNKKCSYNEDSMGDILGHNHSHVLSNLVYIAVGLVTGVYVCCRRKMQDFETAEEQRERECCGLYTARCNGMYVNASMALMVEGCLSGLYHICPTTWNNQFDYIGITMVCLSLFLMLWSKRHPLIVSVGTWAVFFGYLIILCGLSALDARHEHLYLNLGVWVLYLFFYFLFMPRILVMLHYGLPFITPDRAEAEWIGCRSSLKALEDMPGHTKGLFLFMWLVGFCWFGYCVYTHTMLTSAVMKYSCIYLATYMMFYIVMESLEFRARLREKCAEERGAEDGRELQVVPQGPREPADGGGGQDGPGAGRDGCPQAKKESCSIRSRAVTIAIALVTCGVAGTGAYFFTNDVYNTTKSMKESEELNKECTVAGLDYHDLWHLCSGVALGGVIVVSARLEDLSRGVPHDKLLVF